MFDQGYALLVGVGSYRSHALPDVPATLADARELAEALCDPQCCGFMEDRVALLHGEGATRAAMLESLATLAQTAQPEHTVWVFYSGHGDFDAADRYCLTAHDTVVEGGVIAPGSAIDQDELLDALRQIRARRLLLVLNACHAGALPPTLAAQALGDGAGPPPVLAAALLGQGEGRVLITACRAGQRSYIGAGQRTIFAQALVDGLRGPQPAAASGFVGVFDLYNFVHARVSERVRGAYGDQQEPEITIVRGTGPFAVAPRQGAGDAAGAFAPAPTGSAARLVSEEECHRALQQFGGVNFGQGNSVRVGGDVAGGTVDKRSGVFVSGGSLQGTLVGVNYGQVQSYAGAPTPTGPPPTLAQALAQAEAAQRNAHGVGDTELAEDVGGVALLLGAALNAERAGNASRRLQKLREAQRAAHGLAASLPELSALLRMLEQLP